MRTNAEDFSMHGPWHRKYTDVYTEEWYEHGINRRVVRHDCNESFNRSLPGRLELLLAYDIKHHHTHLGE